MTPEQKRQSDAAMGQRDSRATHAFKTNFILTLSEPLRGALLASYMRSSTGLSRILGISALYRQASDNEKDRIIQVLKSYPANDAFRITAKGKSVIAKVDGGTSFDRGDAIFLSDGCLVAHITFESDTVIVNAVTDGWQSFTKQDAEAVLAISGSRDIQWRADGFIFHNRIGRWAFTNDGIVLPSKDGKTSLLMSGKPLTVFYDDKIGSIISDDSVYLSARGVPPSFLSDMDARHVEIACRSLHINDFRVKLGRPEFARLYAENAVVNIERMPEICEQIKLSHSNLVVNEKIAEGVYVSQYLSSLYLLPICRCRRR